MIDAKEEFAIRRVPLRVALSVRELEDFEWVTVRVLEVERLDPARRGIPVWKALRLGRGVLDVVFTQARVCLAHVGHDDGDVLEPAIVAARVDGNRSPARREVLGELNFLAAESHADNAHAKAEHALQLVVFVAGDFLVGDFLERQHVLKERHGAVHVRDGHADALDRFDQRGR